MKTNKIIILLMFVFLPHNLFPQEKIDFKLDLKEKKLPFGLTKQIPIQKPIVSLALSGGGARAISHVGAKGTRRT